MRYWIAGLLLLFVVATTSAQDNHSRGYDIALERIAYAQEHGDTVLMLNSLNLKSLPPEIGELEQLERLYLNYNRLETLPPEIGNLVNLRILNLSYNELESLPHEFGNLTNLYRLWLHDNDLVDVPVSIATFDNLCYLYVQNNPMPVSDVPFEIYQHTASHRADCALAYRTPVAPMMPQITISNTVREPRDPVSRTTNTLVQPVETVQQQTVWHATWIVVGMSLSIAGAVLWVIFAYREPVKRKRKRH